MSGIYGMAGLTIFVAAILSITMLNSFTHSDHRFYWLVCAGFPLSLIVNRLVKVPLINGIGALAGIPLQLGQQMPVWFIVMIWLSAPIFEEAIKAVLLAIPSCHVFLRESTKALWAGLALGIGFGMGEAAYLAYGIAQSPAYNQFPWYAFTGFAFERFAITFGHGLLTSIVVLGFHYGGKRAVIGYLAAVGLHALINLGPILLVLKIIPANMASLGTYATLLVAFVLFQKNLQAVRKNSESKNDPGEKVYFER